MINACRHYRVFGLLERKFLEYSFSGNDSFIGTKVLRTFALEERKFHGSESSLCGLFAPGNESAEDRKGLHSYYLLHVAISFTVAAGITVPKNNTERLYLHQQNRLNCIVSQQHLTHVGWIYCCVRTCVGLHSMVTCCVRSE